MKIFNIQHFSTGDGYGIRSTVFLSGCRLRCPWCHNPEGLYGRGRDCTLAEVVEDVMGDVEFYRRSDGGVTVSGGDPLCSIDDCIELARAFKTEGLHVIVDTSLALECERLEELARYVDCFFVDLKTPDAEKLAGICGGDFDAYEENLRRLKALGCDVVLRIPLIPGFNMDAESLDGMISLVKRYDCPITLLPFHRLGSAKYTDLGLEYAYADTQPQTKMEIDAIRERFDSAGIVTAKV